MTEATTLNPKLVRQLLHALRPIDLSLATKVTVGSALAPLPTVEALTQQQAALFWLTALTSYAQNQSHSGLSLDPELTVAGIFSDSDSRVEAEGLRLVDVVGSIQELPERYANQCARANDLDAHPQATFVYRPEANLIYLNRWYRMEAELGAFFRERLQRAPLGLPEGFESEFQKFFCPSEISENPWQAAACLAALRSRFAVITGGPGTGKTTTITRLLCLLMSLSAADRPQRVKMVAQTGKAAERMREAFNANLETVLDTLPESEREGLSALCRERVAPASTIHSLLGYRGHSGFTHHPGNPVSCDFLIVDEATMVDLELYLKLFKALSADCRIVLLGDKNQLSAVETGNVFSDLTTTATAATHGLNVFSAGFAQCFAQLSGSELPGVEAEAPLLKDQVVELVKSYRFSADSEVGRFASLLLKEGRLPQAGETVAPIALLNGNWKSFLYTALRPFKTAFAGASASPEVLLREVEATRVLCAVRSGPQGVYAVNELLSEFVFGSGQRAGVPTHGLPIIIVRNDKNLGLWNGDCGVFFKDAETGQLGAYFPGKGEGDAPRRYNPFALPEWEPAFALTIHKSQGSEYACVVVVLPQLKRNFVTWELVYTGITRGKEKVSLILAEAQLGQALPRVARVSGLRCELGE